MTQRQIPAVAPKCVVALLFQRHQAHKIVSTKSKVRNSTKHYTGPCRKKKTLQGKAKRKNKKREFGGGGGRQKEGRWKDRTKKNAWAIRKRNMRERNKRWKMMRKRRIVRF